MYSPVMTSGSRPTGQARPWDEDLLRHALRLGARHLGATWPNPSVGALVVREDKAGPVILSRGITQPGGRPHAERQALDGAGISARGATLYVSLEPCSHHGRTPPCADAIVAAGISRVVSAMEDPDIRVRGQGHAALRAAGIDVVTPLLKAEARQVHLGHITRILSGRPAVTLKLARTSDGYAGRQDRGRLMITGAAANDRVHLMRAHADAIMIGAGTAVADDPHLTVRLPGLSSRSPVRVVIDSDLGLVPFASNLIESARDVPVWIVTCIDAPAAPEMTLREAGVEVLRVEPDMDGRVNLPSALQLLAQRGITRLLCEGGPVLADALARADLIDEAIIITGPDALGSLGEPAILPGLATRLVQSLKPVTTEMAGSDLFEFHTRIA